VNFPESILSVPALHSEGRTILGYKRGVFPHIKHKTYQPYMRNTKSVAWAKRGFLSLSLSICLLPVAARSQITLGNASFENPALGAGGSTTVVPDWTAINANANNQGIFVNDGTTLWAGNQLAGVDGDQLAYINAKGVSGFSQQASSVVGPNPVFQNGWTYTLTVALGVSSTVKPTQGNFSIGLDIQNNLGKLVPVATTMVAWNDPKLKPGVSLVDYSVSYVAAGAPVGQSIYAVLQSDGTDPGVTTAWLADNVRITSVPEPSVVALFTLGIAATLLHSRKKGISS
jgi:PEP-CTERM motif